LLLIFILTAADTNVSAQELKITASQKIVYTKQSIQLRVTPSIIKNKVEWKSSNKRIAVVSKKGIVTGKRTGNVKIYAIYKKSKVSISIKVQKFKERKISSKGILEIGSEELMNYLKKGHKVFNSKQEINKYIEYINSRHIKEDNIFNDIRKKLLRYKKSYFRNKSLCLIKVAEISGGYDIDFENMRLTQSKGGKILGQINVNITKLDTHNAAYPDAIWTYYEILELSKKDIKKIQGYTIKKHYYDLNRIK
jgi:hypothetical protein